MLKFYISPCVTVADPANIIIFDLHFVKVIFVNRFIRSCFKLQTLFYMTMITACDLLSSMKRSFRVHTHNAHKIVPHKIESSVSKI